MIRKGSSALLAEKILQKGAACFFHKAALPLGGAMQKGIAGQIVDAAAAALTFIGGAVDAAAQLTHDHGAGAHGTRLQRDVQGAVAQTPITQQPRALLQAEHRRRGVQIPRKDKSKRRLVELGFLVLCGGNCKKEDHRVRS